MTRLFTQEANWVNSGNEEIAQKIYVEPSQIILTNEAIFVNIGGDVACVDQLNCDANGF